MNPFRRPFHRVRPDEGPTLHGAMVVVPGSSDAPPAGDGAVHASGAQVDLVATPVGIIVGTSAGPRCPVPSLTPWSAVVGAAVTGPAALPDGSMGCVVEVALVAGSDLEGPVPTRYVLPATDVEQFLAAVSAGASGSEAASTTAIGRSVERMAGAWALAAGWAASLRPTGGDPRHGLGRRRVGPVAIGLMALVLLAGSGRGFESVAGGDPPGSGSAQTHVQEVGNGLQASRVHATVTLPAATSTPAPAPPSLAGSAPLQSHEIFGYAPYWTLPQSTGFDVKDLTTLAYFSVDANADGTLDESGAGWNGYESQDLVNLVNRSHAAGDRVVLTVT